MGLCRITKRVMRQLFAILSLPLPRLSTQRQKDMAEGCDRQDSDYLYASIKDK